MPLKIFLKLKDFLVNPLSRRQRFVLTALLSASGLVGIQVFPESWRYNAVAIHTLLTLALVVWSLWPIWGIKFLTLLILPAFFTVSLDLFYFLLPVRWATRLPMVFLYGAAFYSLLLTVNIYNVSAMRTIQLLRAAHAVGFLFTLLTALFLYNVVFSLHPAVYFVFGGVSALSFPLLLQALWSVRLSEEGIGKQEITYSIIGSLIIGEMAAVLFFWPLRPVMASLGLVTVMYLFLGLAQFEFQGKLFKKTVIEYLVVAGIVFVILLLTTRWG